MDADDSSTLTSLHVVRHQLGGALSEEHLGAVDNRRSMLLVRIRAARVPQCAEFLGLTDPAEGF